MKRILPIILILFAFIARGQQFNNNVQFNKKARFVGQTEVKDTMFYEIRGTDTCKIGIINHIMTIECSSGVTLDTNIFGGGGGGVTGSGANERVAIWSGTSSLTSDGSFSYNTSFSRLGLGATYGTATFLLKNKYPTNVPFAFIVNDTLGQNIFSINKSGNITSNDTSKLAKTSYVSSTTGPFYHYLQNNSGKIWLGLEGSAAGTLFSGTLAYASAIGTATVSTALQFATNNIVRMTLLNGGNVGIGTTSPDSAFQVTGGLKFVNGTQGNGKVLTSTATGAAYWSSPSSGGGVGDTSAIEFVFGNGLAVADTGQTVYVEVPFNCTILRATILNDQSSNTTVQLWKDTYANHPPVLADKIYNATPPSTSAAVKNQDTTLSGWTTSIATGDILAGHLSQNSAAKSITVSLKVVKN